MRREDVIQSFDWLLQLHFPDGVTTSTVLEPPSPGL